MHDGDLAAAVSGNQQRIDQAMHLQRFLAGNARRPFLLDGIEEVAPDAQMIVVREGHGVGAGAAR